MFLIEETPLSFVLFLGVIGINICSLQFGVLPEAARRLKSWGSQMELADKSERGVNLSYSSVAEENNLLDEDFSHIL